MIYKVTNQTASLEQDNLPVVQPTIANTRFGSDQHRMRRICLNFLAQLTDKYSEVSDIFNMSGPPNCFQ